MAAADLSRWTMEELQHALRHQTAPVISTWGLGLCGHPARGGNVCERCLRDEIERREKGER